MDIVEFCGVNPLLLQIIDLKFDIGRHEGGLNWADVVAQDFSRGISVAHVNGPDASAGADI